MPNQRVQALLEACMATPFDRAGADAVASLGANLNITSGVTKRTALMQVAAQGRLDALDWLLAHQPDLGRLDNQKKTALLHALEYPSDEPAHRLLAAGDRPQCLLRAMHVFRAQPEAGLKAIVRLLRLGAHIDAPDAGPSALAFPEVDSVLVLATRYGAREWVEGLLVLGARVRVGRPSAWDLAQGMTFHPHLAPHEQKQWGRLVEIMRPAWEHERAEQFQATLGETLPESPGRPRVRL